MSNKRMSLANRKFFTIGDLAKIALGTKGLTDERLHVLQILFLAVLRKLNCHNETVKIKGLAAKCLQQLLTDFPNNCQFSFQFENIKSFQKNYNLLEELERKTQEINTKLEQHCQRIRRNYKKTNIFAANIWRTYASPTEDLGAQCLKENRKYWFLIESLVFNSELRRRVVPQVVGRLKKFEDQIEAMQNQLLEITKLADHATEKLQSIEFIIKDVEDLRSFVSIREKDFHDTIAEIDEMLSCKLHRVTIPALRKFLEKRFADANRHLRVLRLEAKKLPPTKPLLIEDKKTCLSCCHHRDFTVLKTIKSLKSIAENLNCSCCNLLKDPSIIERIQHADLIGPRSSRKTEQILSFYEADSKGLGTLKTTSREPEYPKTSLTRKEDACKGREFSQYGPLS